MPKPKLPKLPKGVHIDAIERLRNAHSPTAGYIQHEGHFFTGMTNTGKGENQHPDGGSLAMTNYGDVYLFGVKIQPKKEGGRTTTNKPTVVWRREDVEMSKLGPHPRTTFISRDLDSRVMSKERLKEHIQLMRGSIEAHQDAHKALQAHVEALGDRIELSEAKNKAQKEKAKEQRKARKNAADMAERLKAREADLRRAEAAWIDRTT